MAFDIKSLVRAAITLRLDTLSALHSAQSGHPGAALSIADVLTYLCCEEMCTEGEDRDRLIMSKGHASAALYASFVQLGWIPREELASLRQIGSRLQGHPDRTRLPCVDAGTGALGQGLSIAIGYALAARLRKSRARAFCIIGDGECQEGQVWEAAMHASAAGIDNLIAVVDANGLQNEDSVADTLDMGNLADRFRAFGWNVCEIDGHDFEQMHEAFQSARHILGTPTLVYANTIKGKGVAFMEGDNAWHSNVLSDAQYEAAQSGIRNGVHTLQESV